VEGAAYSDSRAAGCEEKLRYPWFLLI